MIAMLINTVRKAISDRRRYARMMAEIEAMDHRELADLRADRFEMARLARAEIFGEID